MPTSPDDTFPLPANVDERSVWADRSGHRSLIGRNQRGVQIPIGKGEGEISPGELLKLALIGCAGMTSDIPLARRLGEDFAMRLWAHGLADSDENRYTAIREEVQLSLEDRDEAAIQQIVTVFERAVAAGCTVERTVVPGAEVTHTVLQADGTPGTDDPSASDEDAGAAR